MLVSCEPGLVCLQNIHTHTIYISNSIQQGSAGNAKDPTTASNQPCLRMRMMRGCNLGGSLCWFLLAGQRSTTSTLLLSRTFSTMSSSDNKNNNEPEEQQDFITIVGFGSLLSERSSRVTFPDLQNFLFLIFLSSSGTLRKAELNVSVSLSRRGRIIA